MKQVVSAVITHVMFSQYVEHMHILLHNIFMPTGNSVIHDRSSGRRILEHSIFYHLHGAAWCCGSCAANLIARCRSPSSVLSSFRNYEYHVHYHRSFSVETHQR